MMELRVTQFSCVKNLNLSTEDARKAVTEITEILLDDRVSFASVMGSLKALA